MAEGGGSSVGDITGAVGAGFSIAGSILAFRDQQISRDARISQLGSNAATLDIDRDILGIQRQAGRNAASTQQDLFGLNRDEIGVRQGLLDKQEAFAITAEGFGQERIGLDRRTLEANRRGERSQEAFARGNIRLGVAEATAKGRIQSAQLKLL